MRGLATLACLLLCVFSSSCGRGYAVAGEEIHADASSADTLNEIRNDQSHNNNNDDDEHGGEGTHMDTGGEESVAHAAGGSNEDVSDATASAVDEEHSDDDDADSAGDSASDEPSSFADANDFGGMFGHDLDRDDMVVPTYPGMTANTATGMGVAHECVLTTSGLVHNDTVYFNGDFASLSFYVSLTPSCFDFPDTKLMIYGNAFLLIEYEVEPPRTNQFVQCYVPVTEEEGERKEVDVEWWVRVALGGLNEVEFAVTEPVRIVVQHGTYRHPVVPFAAFEQRKIRMPPCSCPFDDFLTREAFKNTSAWPHMVDSDWKFDCGEYDKQIIDDLSPWHGFNSRKITKDELMTAFSKPTAAYYVIYSGGRLYAKWKDRVVYYHEAFLDMLDIMKEHKMLPENIQFVVQLDDFMEVPHYYEDAIMSGSKTSAHHDIVMPFLYTWITNTHAYADPRLMSVSPEFSSDTTTCPAFAERIKKLYFRGRCIHCYMQGPRWRVQNLTWHYPELFDAGVVGPCCGSSKEEIAGGNLEIKMSGPMPINHNCQYQFLLLIDGWTVSGRAPWLWNMGSVVFKPESPYKEFFYGTLKPWVHYIPVSEHLEDLLDKVIWAYNHPEEVDRIRLETIKYARRHLHTFTPLCYMHRLLQGFSTVMEPFERRETEMDYLMYEGFNEL